ncbi:MAG: DUF1566 domain-containing protein [Spirochaetia bacterium]|nr:DUF1566 domain-containing protein [Spirochaetia bacterium]
MRLIRISFVILLASFMITACKKTADEDAVSYADLALLATFGDQGNGTITAPGGYLVAKCAVGQVWNGGLNNCSGTGSGTTYGAQSMAYCSVANSCSDTTTLLATSGPAFVACANYSVSGITGWRLPSVTELTGLTTSFNRNTIILMFPQTPDDKFFWTRETNPNKTDYSEAYGISFAETTFGTMTSYDKVASPLYVRCVK